MIDRARGKDRFLLLGSASPTFMRSVSETPAGRVCAGAGLSRRCLSPEIEIIPWARVVAGQIEFF
jgi:predicted AAA+ superfamily ATPase